MGSHRVGHNWSDLAAAAAAYIGNIPLLHSQNIPHPPSWREKVSSTGTPWSSQNNNKLLKKFELPKLERKSYQ